MASRRLLWSLLRSSLSRSPPEFQLATTFRPFSFPDLSSRLSPIPIRKFPQTEAFSRFESSNGLASVLGSSRLALFQQAASLVPPLHSRFMSTETSSVGSSSEDSSAPEPDVPPRIKFKRLDKTARHIMQILDKEAVEEVRTQREIPDIKPGYIVQLKVEVPENKRRASIIKGIVIARRNAGLNSTFRIRRQVAGVGIESLFPLYSPNIKEIKVLDKKKVRRAKLYYLRDKMNALKKSS
ncbi:large ribosomal subunit protein bL19cy-like [Gastrolobium bilobum]|uniref:large ribosomal subunit protein bL19cy-like n=1 Tax=Gastrolobium bilobum TaxID=150636 RepID=UPI002AAFC9BB|nr:large ribosomal subunit protein bL19cy-like [Gastrolobium bilobum]